MNTRMIDPHNIVPPFCSDHFVSLRPLTASYPLFLYSTDTAHPEIKIRFHKYCWYTITFYHTDFSFLHYYLLISFLFYLDVLLFLITTFSFYPYCICIARELQYNSREYSRIKHEGLQPLYDDGNRCRIAVLAIAVLLR